MKEKEKSPSAEWGLYGSDYGGKVDDLLTFKKENAVNVEVVPGKAIGASFFRELILENGFDSNSFPEDINQTGKLPVKLERTNREIISSFPPGTCVAIRSSVVGENGGVGIYSSFFMVTTGDSEADLNTLAKLELQIYADYFSYDSRDYLGDKFLNPNRGGVGLLVQEVIGDQYGEFFMPAISGVATAINGELTLRLVLGLGTKAVEMKDAIVIKRNNLRQEVIEKALFSMLEAETISLTERKTVLNPLEYEWKVRMVSQVEKLMRLIEDWKNLEKNGTAYYWEFAVAESHDHPKILQSNLEKPFDERTTELGPVTGRIICESKNDVVNTGETSGRGIVYINLSGFTPEDLNELYRFNQNNQGYLLIVNDTLFSYVAHQNRLNLKHFSNAAGVVERQIVRPTLPFQFWGGLDHVGRGGTHFIELCKRRDILFQGVISPKWDDSLEEALGPFSQRFGQFGAYWDIEYKMTNTKDEGRVEVYGEVAGREYSREKLHLWIDELRKVAEFLESEDKDVSDAFYNLSYHLITAVGHSVADYDPYGFVDQLSPESLQELKGIFVLVFQNIHLTESYSIYMESHRYEVSEREGNVFELKEYLQKLKLKIEAKRATITS
ncbi:hypothetical protein HYU91_03565 [Candidatus Collierbacteria bacterium]|nr:hypothetical protein [Candidatus Collierbacteria bacterium]